MQELSILLGSSSCSCKTWRCGLETEPGAAQAKQPAVQKDLPFVPVANAKFIIFICIFLWLQFFGFIVWFTLTYCCKYDTTTMPKDFGQNKDWYVLSLQL